jgi:AcrR family transcriptional regulator
MTPDRPPKSSQATHRRGRPRLDAQMVPLILDAAERLFAKRDSLSVGIREIASEAGVPHSAIYRYFASKDEIFRQVLERGRDRQLEHEAEGRATGRGVEGAIEWIMTDNRSYALAMTRAALEGQTPSSLGLNTLKSVSRQSARLVATGELPFKLRTDHDPRLVVAAGMALALGWAACEEWIVESAGLEACDRGQLRGALDQIIESLMAMGQSLRTSPQAKGIT